MHHELKTSGRGRSLWRWGAAFALLLALCGGFAATAKAENIVGGPIPLAVGSGSSGVAINTQTNRVYVANKSSTISVIDGATNSVVTTINTPGFHLGITVNEQTNRVYVADGFNDTVTVIDGATNTVITTIPVPGFAEGIAVNPQTNRIYVALQGGGPIAVIDGTTNAVTLVTVGTTGHEGIAVNTQTNTVYVTNTDGTVSVVDGATNTVVGAPIPTGARPLGIAVNEQTNRIYVANKSDGTVSVLDGATNSVVGAPIPAGNSPHAIALSPLLNRVYAANGSDGGSQNTVQIIDGATNTVVGTLTVGHGPAGLAFNSQTNRGYVANQTDSTVSVFSAVATTVNGDNATATYGAATATLTATVTASDATAINEGTVTFTVRRADNSVLGTATSGPVVNGSASVSFAVPSGTGAGTYSIVAAYNATATFAASTDATPATLTITPATQTITFDQPANRNANDAPFTVNPTTTSGLPLTIEAAGPCFVSGTTVTLTGQGGSCALTARQAGDANYLPATLTRTFQVALPAQQYTVTASASGNGTVTPAGATSYNAGTVATYSAAAAAGQTFTGWTLDGQYVGYANPLTITVGTSHTLSATFVATPTFSDISTLPAADQQAITFLAALGIINPNGVNGSGQFQPKGDVARAEIAAFVARTFGWESEFHANTFPDRCTPTDPNNCIDARLWNDVAALKDYGIVGGYTDPATCQSGGTTAPCYLPRDGVQRVQVVSIVARAFIKAPDLRPTGFWDRLAANGAQYTNVGTEGTQRSDLTTYRANAGEVPGQTDSATFVNPTGNATRLFVIEVLYQAYNAQFGTDRVP